MSRFDCVRSDMGDGGWSLHAEHEGMWVRLADGPSAMGDDGEWARPNAADYAFADRQLQRLEDGELTAYECERASCREVAS